LGVHYPIWLTFSSTANGVRETHGVLRSWIR
jgi:hypothetical protein